MTAEIHSLRASSMPLAFRCAASVRRPDLAISDANESALLGSAGHEALRSLAESGSVDWAEIPGIAARFSVAEDDLRAICAMASKLWPRVAASFPEALTEIELSAEVAPGVRLYGHIDLLSVTDTVARAGDWKTGWRDNDYSQQMRAYGALVLLDNPALTEVTVTVIWIRDGEIETYTMNREALGVWLSELDSRVVRWDGVYRPGNYCPECPRSHECQAANALARRDIAAVADRELVARAESELALMPADQIIGLHAKARTVRQYAERVHEAIRNYVETNGDVVAPDGSRLTIKTEERRALDPVKAWPVLEEAGFKDQDFADCMDLRVSRVEKRVAESAGRGKGAAAVRALSARLEDVGAVRVKETRRLQDRRS